MIVTATLTAPAGGAALGDPSPVDRCWTPVRSPTMAPKAPTAGAHRLPRCPLVPLRLRLLLLLLHRPPHRCRRYCCCCRPLPLRLLRPALPTHTASTG